MCYGGPSAYWIIAAGASFQRLALELDPNEQRVLTQLVAKIDETPEGPSATVIGPIYAELWLTRQDNKHNVLLDQGFIQGGPLAHEIGFLGRVAYSQGDYVVLKFWNDTGAAMNLALTSAWDKTELGKDDVGACRITRLSTKHEAHYELDMRVTNDGSTAGAHGYDVLANSPSVLIGAKVLTNESVSLYMGLYNDATTTLDHCFWTGVAVQLLYAPNSVAAVTSSGQVANPEFATGGKFRLETSSLAISKYAQLTLLLRIKGRAPTIVITKPAGAVTTTNLAKVVP